MRTLTYLILALLLIGCAKTECPVIPPEPSDTIKMHRAVAPADTMQNADTSRVPVTFFPSVEDWEENDVDL